MGKSRSSDVRGNNRPFSGPPGRKTTTKDKGDRSSSSPESLVSHTVGGGATTSTDDKSTGACSSNSKGNMVASNHKAEIMVAAHQKAEDMEVETDNLYVENSDDEHFMVQQSKRNMHRRANSNESHGEQPQSKQAQNIGNKPLSDQTLRTVYIKGQDTNLAKSLELKGAKYFIQDLTAQIGKPEHTDYKGNSVRIVCRNEEQKQALLKVSEIDGKRIIVSLPWSLQKRNKSLRDQSQITWNIGVITRVTRYLDRRC